MVLPFVPVRWIGRELELGRPEVLQQRADALERRRAPPARRRRHADARLQVDVRVEPGPRRSRAGAAHASSGGASSTSTAQLGADLGRELGDLARLAHVGLGARRAPRAVRRVSCTTTRSTGVTSETFCSDFALRTAASTSPVDLEHERVAAGEPQPRRVRPRGAVDRALARTTTTPLRSRTA